MFDPYEKWLGISPDRRPINFYQLLGVSPGEGDAAVIEKAAQRQAAKVRAYQEGPQAQASARLLKEIAQAKTTLVNPVKRKEYDARLGKAARPAEADGAADKADPAGEEAETGEKAAPGPAKGQKKKGSKKRRQAEEKAPSWLWPAVGGAAALLLLGVAAAIWFTRHPKTEVPTPPEVAVVATATTPEPPPPTTRQKETAKAAPPAVVPPPPKPPATPPKPPPAPVAAGCEGPGPKTVATTSKLPVPDEAAQAKAEKTLKDTYRADYDKSKPEDRLLLAAKLLQPGRENRNDPAAWYVLLREARDLAVEGGGPRLAVEAVNALDQSFAIPDPLGMKVKALTTISEASTERGAISVAQTALGLVNQAVNDDNYDTALRLVGVAEAAVHKLRANKKELDLVKTRKTEVDNQARDYQPVAQARTNLGKNPDDPGANLTVGKHLCFFQGKWEEGLPLLAKGGDAALKDLAQKDLSRPATLEGQLGLADHWWDRGEGEKGRIQLNIRLRAKSWYERVGPKATGLPAIRMADRMKEAEELASGRLLRLFPGSFFGRDLEDRTLLLRESGGTMESEEAVRQGLEWLARHQAPSGMWATDAFQQAGQCNCTEPGEKFDIAGTAFGLLPFLGAGETHLRGQYAKTVQKGLVFLLASQKKEGNFSGNMYENALATIAVCEAYGLTKDSHLQIPAQAAVSFIVRAQSSEGSWGYSPGAPGDTSVSGWQFAALKAGLYAGLQVPKDPFNKLSGFLDRVADPNGIGYGYKTPAFKKSTTAVGLLVREFMGWGPGQPALVKGMEQLLRPENLPSRDNLSIYYLFYATQVMHHAGCKSWESWNTKVRDLLIELQDQGNDPEHPHQKGSWSPRGDEYGVKGGRLMFTSLALITLEIYYYHIPLYNYGPAVLMD